MKRKKFIAIFMIVFTIMLSSFAFYGYQVLFTPNVLPEKEDRLFAIAPGASFKDVQNALYDQGIVTDLVSFSVVAKLKDYDRLVKPGLYQLRKDMSNLEAVNLLRSGNQTPVKVTFSVARQLKELAVPLSSFFAFDSTSLASLLMSDSIASSYGFEPHTFISMFIPNTYEMYWTSSPRQVLDRMKSEYDRFWNDERKQKASSMGLTPLEVSTLASIVESETNKLDEAGRIAGVYINRLKRSIPLQADPTLVFALGDFTVRRVLDKDKRLDSPYNTYKYEGLPPGPIRLPTIAGINAVLNYESHKYIYFCAKDDFSGYHAFARTYREHLINARKFQRALNNERIFR
ncbi:MAG: endolytic transglycosylase MltG [Cyclobacteriaceae bacterium]|nr:endolytic transglycosylase MltG [Cyclobacteriaceae bacterium HetDA_MAG_MS6]